MCYKYGTSRDRYKSLHDSFRIIRIRVQHEHKHTCVARDRDMERWRVSKSMVDNDPMILTITKCHQIILPYFGKRKQVTKVAFLVKEQNESVISTDVNRIS